MELTGTNLNELVERAGFPDGYTVSGRDGSLTFFYEETRDIAVLAFGWVHFKECCAEYGVGWESCKYIGELDDIKDLTPGDTLLLSHSTVSNERMLHLRTYARSKRFKV